MLYAVGEIILVVIGILIALGINNWNDQKKNNEAELQYYCKVLDDLELDKKLLEELKSKADNRISLSKEVLLELDSGKKDKKYLLNKFLTAIRTNNYVPRNMTFKDLISSGNIKLFKDDKIKNSLIQYYSDLEDTQSQIKENRDEHIKEVFQLVNSSIEFGMYEFDYVNKLVGSKIIETLPKNDWTNDKNSDFYKSFQKVLMFNITIADREKQHFNTINTLMDSPYQLLKKKCMN